MDDTDSADEDKLERKRRERNKRLKRYKKDTTVGLKKPEPLSRRDTNVMPNQWRNTRLVKSIKHAVSSITTALSSQKVTQISASNTTLLSMPNHFPNHTASQPKPPVPPKVCTPPVPPKVYTPPVPPKVHILPVSPNVIKPTESPKLYTPPIPSKVFTPPVPSKVFTPPVPSKVFTPPVPSKVNTTPVPPKAIIPPTPPKVNTPRVPQKVYLHPLPQKVNIRAVPPRAEIGAIPLKGGIATNNPKPMVTIKMPITSLPQPQPHTFTAMVGPILQSKDHSTVSSSGPKAQGSHNRLNRSRDRRQQKQQTIQPNPQTRADDRVIEANGRPKRLCTNEVIIENIAPFTTKQSISGICQTIGRVEKCSIEWHGNGQPYGKAQFADPRHATEFCNKFNGFTFDCKRIVVRLI